MVQDGQASRRRDIFGTCFSAGALAEARNMAGSAEVGECQELEMAASGEGGFAWA